MSPTGKMPQLVESVKTYFKPIELKEGEVLLRSELSTKFRYTIPSEEECDQITSGGADLVY